MRKIFSAILLMFCMSGAFAINFGTYKTDTEYGLIDGFKWNLFKKDKDAPLVQLKSEIEADNELSPKVKEKQKPTDEEEIRLYRFMLENTVAF